MKEPHMTRKQFAKMIRVFNEFYGIMSLEQISEEYGFPLNRLKRLRDLKQTKIHSLCWTCKYASDATKCKYVASCIGYGRYPQYYPDTEVSKKGRILTCSHYKEG